MKKRKVILLTIALSLLFCSVAYASQFEVGQGSDAVNDILNSRRFSGAIEFVNMIGSRVDNLFAMFISWMSFFMISTACLRNVLAATYVQFPRFWDAVAEAHAKYEGSDQGQGQGWFTQIQHFTRDGGWKNTNGSTIGTWLLHLVPNVRSMTEFESGENVDFKQYFMRAIPEGVIGVYLGVFCYNGYYRDVLAVTSSFGAKLTYQALLAVKPDEILYKLMNISGTPSHPTQNVTSGTDYIARLMTEQSAGYVQSQYPDQAEKKNKEQMWLSLDNVFVPYAAQNFSTYANTNQWRVTVKPEITSTQVDLKDTSSSDGMNVIKHVWFPMTTFALNSSYNQDKDMYLHIQLQFVDKGADASAADINISDFVLTLPSDGMSSSGVSLPSGNYGYLTTSAGKAQKIGDWVVHVSKSTLAFELGGKNPDTMTAYATTNMSYTDVQLKRVFNISAVKFAPGVTPTLSSTSTGISISIGESVRDAWVELRNNSAKNADKSETQTTEESAD